MVRVFVSGYYDLIHAGHLQFFAAARALGDHLTVSLASAEVLWAQRQRRSSLPDEHKRALLAGLRSVDAVVVGTSLVEGLDFQDEFLQLRPDILAVTDDDRFGEVKRALCARVGAQYVVLPKTPPQFPAVSTSEIVRWIRAPQEAPLRVDFAGGWLDVPRFARDDGFIVNCAIAPTVSLRAWPYERNAGLGGSGAWALLNGISSELDLGVGWQDPAVISESGLCVWRSGPRPGLELKSDGAMLRGRLALLWTGTSHDTPGLAAGHRDFGAIARAGQTAREAVWQSDLGRLAAAVRQSYAVQRDEGMAPLPGDASAPAAAPHFAAGPPLAMKYCGGGFGGYAVYLFAEPAQRDAACTLPGFRAIEPYLAEK